MKRKILYFDKQRSFREMLLNRICEEFNKVEITVTSNIMELILFSKNDHFSFVLIDLHSIDSDIKGTIHHIKKLSCKEIKPLLQTTKTKKLCALKPE